MARALYVDIDLIHLNPAATYFPPLIEAAVPDVSFFGPGFSSPDALAKGLSNWSRGCVDEAGHDVTVAWRKVTANNHSLQARAGQIALCLKALADGTYRGARWRQGEFFVEER